MLRRAVCVLLFCGGCLVSNGFAEEGVTVREFQELQERVRRLEERLAEQDECILEQKRCISEQEKKISEYDSRLAAFDAGLHRQEGAPMSIGGGLEIGAGATIIVQGTDNANAPGQLKQDRTDASYSADITIGKEFSEVGGRAFLHVEAGAGSGLEDDLVLYSNVNRDTDDDENVHLTEVWYEQVLLGDRAVLTFGKLDPTAYFDGNEAANDETTQFLGRIFRNNPVIEFPDNTAGIRLAYVPKEGVELGYGVFDADSDWEKIADHLFHIGQVTFETAFGGRPGHTRFLGWFNDAPHTEWLQASRTKEEAFGFALSFDQEISDNITAFCRYGWQEPDVYDPDITAADGSNFSLEHSWSAGLQIEGEPWGREQDVWALAVGQAVPSRDYKRSNAGLRAKTEGHLEAYYRIHVNDHLSITPDFQYIWNPFGKDVAGDTDGIFVGGMRTQIDF